MFIIDILSDRIVYKDISNFRQNKYHILYLKKKKIKKPKLCIKRTNISDFDSLIQLVDL